MVLILQALHCFPWVIDFSNTYWESFFQSLFIAKLSLISWSNYFFTFHFLFSL